MKVIDVPEPAAINRRPVALTFNDFNEDTCYNRYRFLKPDLWRYRLQVLPSTKKFGTEEALLIFLQRLAFPTRFSAMVSIYNEI
jgi:hypothetical protein